ncbi:MAG: hypothetical protein IPH06_12325 [Alphaproteobacteria bacterium]|jgi:hypothetical protein|nr:hypothetical protein [Alphaproteobacteria bacterium]QQS56255.1 MAG: hypothetical protein IPN28_08080 [Alphaproteobacteria bacterium]
MQFPTPQEAMRRLALTISHPGSGEAFNGDGFAHVAKQINDSPYSFRDYDEIVLLGQGQKVGHIIVVRGSDVVCDRQKDVLNLPSYYDPVQREYKTKLTHQSSSFMVLRVLDTVGLMDFKLEHGLEAPPPPAALDHDS